MIVEEFQNRLSSNAGHLVCDSREYLRSSQVLPHELCLSFRERRNSEHVPVFNLAEELVSVPELIERSGSVGKMERQGGSERLTSA